MVRLDDDAHGASVGVTSHEKGNIAMTQQSERSETALVLGIVSFSHDKAGLAMSTDHVTRVQLPNRLSTEDVQRMQKDYELLASVLRDHPEEMKNLFEAHSQKDIKSARRIAGTLGISEESFKAQGGGVIWAIVGGLVVCDVFLGCLTSWAWDGI
jgi:hypothetical protein